MQNNQIVSIGYDCLIKMKYNDFCKFKKINCGETNFFDYLLDTSIKSIKLLCENKIEDILNNLKFEEIKNYKKLYVYFTKLDNIISMHDLCKNYSKAYYKKFIDKYKRRYFRFLDLIKNNKFSYFIRNGKINDDEFDNLNSLILKLNNNKKFIIVSIHKDNINEVKDNFVKLNFNNFEISKKYDKYYTNIDWNKIFNYILSLKKV